MKSWAIREHCREEAEDVGSGGRTWEAREGCQLGGKISGEGSILGILGGGGDEGPGLSAPVHPFFGVIAVQTPPGFSPSCCPPLPQAS